MRSKLRSNLTYANVMATIAVFIALGGSSYAAIQVTGKNVRNGSLTGKDVKNASLGKKELSRRAVRSLRGRPGPRGAAGEPVTKLWAVVNSDGTLRRGSGVVGVAAEGPEANRYIVVTFNRDVSNCAHVVSPGYNQSNQANTGEIAAERTTTPVVRPDSVTVQGFESEGYVPPLSPPVNKDFQLAVFC